VKSLWLGCHEGSPGWHLEKRCERPRRTSLEGAEARGPVKSERCDDGGASIQTRKWEHSLTFLQVNPATAYCLLSHFVALERGQWVIQNGANSAVRCIGSTGRALTRARYSVAVCHCRLVRQSYSSREMPVSRLSISYGAGR
jgi:hypothetical protein